MSNGGKPEDDVAKGCGMIVVGFALLGILGWIWRSIVTVWENAGAYIVAGGVVLLGVAALLLYFRWRKSTLPTYLDDIQLRLLDWYKQNANDLTETYPLADFQRDIERHISLCRTHRAAEKLYRTLWRDIARRARAARVDRDAADATLEHDEPPEIASRKAFLTTADAETLRWTAILVGGVIGLIVIGAVMVGSAHQEHVAARERREAYFIEPLECPHFLYQGL